MADTEKVAEAEGFTSVSQTMKDISQTFESSRSDSKHDSTAQENIQAFVRYQDWLKTVQQMQNGFINASAQPEKTPDKGDNAEDITSRIAVLQEALLAESTNHGVKEVIVRSAQLANRLQELVFPRQPDAEDEAADKGEDEEEKRKRGWARDLCDRQRTLASNILAHHQACQSTQDEIDERKQKIRDLQASNAELMKRLQSLEGEKSNDAPSRTVRQAQDELEALVSQITMERGIFQGLVIGSGVNWAKDDHLREVVLGLGKRLELDQ